jgi:hypothetical protein
MNEQQGARMELKAIETRYKGYRFRSRLEARWAVFFEECGVKWGYEVEGFDLPSGRYLPDFYLSEAKCFVEIKPTEPDHRAYQLAGELLRASNKTVYIFFGDPLEALAPGYPGLRVMEAAADIDQPSFWFFADYESAAVKARQARFEHGECGSTSSSPTHPKFVIAPPESGKSFASMEMASQLKK